MPLSEMMEKHLNDQLSVEMYSAYIYLSFAYEMKAMGLPGFEHWCMCQYREEMSHATRIADYVSSRGGNVEFRTLVAPEIEWDCPCEAMRAALEHEKSVTDRIHNIMSAARSESDFATEKFLGWYVTEQVEEESQIEEIIKMLERVGEDQNGLIFIDSKLHKRAHHCAVPV